MRNMRPLTLPRPVPRERSKRSWMSFLSASASVPAGVITPAGVDADAVRRLIYARFDLSLGTGLGKVKGRMFRIGHLGECNDLTLLAALAGCEMGLKLAGVRLRESGTSAAMEYLAATAQPSATLG